MANDAVCINRKAALLIIDTITKAMPAGTQRAALEAVGEWINHTIHDMPKTLDETVVEIKRIETEMRGCMTPRQRREQAAFYLENIDEMLS
jgi:hypothetical protein